jgi:hypothetical protein
MASSRSILSDRPDRRVPARTSNWLLRTLGGACTLFGVFTLTAGDNAVWAYGSLMVCGLVLLATSVLTQRSAGERSSLPTRSSEPGRTSASDLSSMTPPGWDAIPPTIGMAAQPDAYFHNRRDSR